MIGSRILGVTFASLLAAACARHDAAPQQAATAEPGPPTAQQLVDVKVVKISVDHPSIHRDQPATVSVELKGVPPGTDLTLAWFGPDGWLEHDEMKPVSGNSATFVVPAGTFRSPGHYHGRLRAGVVHLADTDLDVTG